MDRAETAAPDRPPYGPSAVAMARHSDMLDSLRITKSGWPMRRFMIERGLTGIGSARREELRAAARRSNEALRKLGPDIQWIESFVTDDRTFCVYLAKDETLIRRHAELSGFPADRITEIRTTIDPSTADE